MCTISAQIMIRCPAGEADRRLACFLHDRHRRIDGALRLDFSANGSTGTLHPLPSNQRSVWATVTAQADSRAMVTSYTVSCSAPSAAAFPTFVGSLWVDAAGDEEDAFALNLDGRSEPPIGDGATCHRCSAPESKAFANHLLEAVAFGIESALARERSARRLRAAGTGPLHRWGERPLHGTRSHRR